MRERGRMMQKRGGIILVVALFLVIFTAFSAKGQTEGCYVYAGGSEDLYCVPGTLDTQAEEDCSNYANCRMQQDFIPGSNCQTIAECQQVTCSVDCQTHALGICQELGGISVPDNQYNYYCTPGCCKIAAQFCQFGLNRFQCQQRAEQLGYQMSSPLVTYANPIGQTLTQCNQLYCQIEILPGQLSGRVYDEQNISISGSTLRIESLSRETISATDGNYAFSDIPAGSYLLTITKEGFEPLSLTISIGSGADSVEDIILHDAAVGFTLQGMVRTERGEGLAGTTISWEGIIFGQTVTDGNGRYTISGLPAGSYRITARKIGFITKERTREIGDGVGVGEIGDDVPAEPLDFTLQEATVQGILGKTFVDDNNNGVADTGEERYGVRLYVDGHFRGFSQYPDGTFELRIQDTGQHQLSATYQQYGYEEHPFTVVPSQLLELDSILLTTYVGECSEDGAAPQKSVDVFTASHVPGKKEVLLSWVKPCAEVISYQIVKKQGSIVVAMMEASPAQHQLRDDVVEWGQTYTYEIIAVYDEMRFSQQPAMQTITLGDARCEGRFHDDTGWETFCIVGLEAERKMVYSCTLENRLAAALQCAERDGPGENFYCAQISAQDAECKDAGQCGLFGDPFGLYYSRNLCYGFASGTASDERLRTSADNFCYYDDTSTILNDCRSCADIQSCFAYKSKDACIINNCLGTSCSWVDAALVSASGESNPSRESDPILDSTSDSTMPLVDYGFLSIPTSVTAETGQGYCVQDSYAQDDRCSLCSSSASLFENYYCTAQVCSQLGRCFSNLELSECSSCGAVPTSDANCYTYTTELECAGAGSVRKTPFNELVDSQDKCSWNKCLWTGAQNGFSAGACVKDANADAQDDCSSFSNGGERGACKVDISAPHTRVVPEGIKVISIVRPNITFLGDDGQSSSGNQRNKMGALGYCLMSADTNAQEFCTVDNFMQVPYPGRLTQELVTVDLLSSLPSEVNGETYKLLFYSEDKYHNREDLQIAFIFIDNVPPQFEINQRINTVGDITTLTAYLEGVSEPMSCDFTLQGVVPRGGAEHATVSREQQRKEVSFSNLPGVIYDMNVTCVDDQGNRQLAGARYTFDVEERITILSPVSGAAVASSSIRFAASTVAGASCELYQGTTKVADFISDEEGKRHETDLLPGFVQGDYAGEYSIVCQNLLTPDIYRDYFDFEVDFTPPSTEIVLQEGTRRVIPTVFGWEEFFVKDVQVDFICDFEGFPCDKTYYCLGDGCEFVGSSGYREYQASVQITNTTTICYYSTDTARNPVYSPLCGTVRVEGYGIVLEKPFPTFYRGEMWGVSGAPYFDLQFYTRVPTQECVFDFTPAFSYEDAPSFRTLHPSAQGRYVYTQFPNNTGTSAYAENGGTKAVYLRCKNLNGEIGPAQKINLEFDPSAPIILEARADPSVIIEGTSSQLLVRTDDKTICRYSSSGQVEYDLMPYALSGVGYGLRPVLEVTLAGGVSMSAEALLADTLEESHEATFRITNLIGLTYMYNLTTQCKNGAGALSPVEYIPLSVDYSQLGGIALVSPQNKIMAMRNVSLFVQTTKNARCEYIFGNISRLMMGEGTRSHTASLSGLEERYYQIPLRCTMGDHRVENAFSFTVDMTAPVVSEVVDGNYTCGNNNINVMIYSNEGNLSGYRYELYEDVAPSTNLTANRTIPIRTTQRRLVLNGSTNATLPLEIPAESLSNSSLYRVRVAAIDAAGHQSSFVESDGVRITSMNHSVCLQDRATPIPEVLLNDSCRAIMAEIHCNDAVGCRKILFGAHAQGDLCIANTSYSGQKVSFTSGGWLCYYVEDYRGNNHTGKKSVIFPDNDGDGITDSCDQCARTAERTTVDERGCSSSEVPEREMRLDADNDALPDFWEQRYNGDECPLQYLSDDSDDNAVADGLEDYDQDGFTNYQEYSLGQNPCEKDAAPISENNTIITSPVVTLPTTTSPPSESDVLAWILLILGIILVLSGTTYLIYYYHFSKGGRDGGKDVRAKAALPSSRDTSRAFTGEEPQAKTAPAWATRLFELRKGRAEKEKEKRRHELFGEFGPFGQSSSRIPHIENVLNKKKADIPKLQELAQKYTEHKEEIEPGLREEEKDVFAKLGMISKRTKEKDIDDVVSKEEAQDIFAKLKEVAKKRKGKETK